MSKPTLVQLRKRIDHLKVLEEEAKKKDDPKGTCAAWHRGAIATLELVGRIMDGKP